MKNISMKQAFFGWIVVSVALIVLVLFQGPISKALHRTQDAAVRAEAYLASYFRVAELMDKSRVRKVGFYVTGIVSAHHTVGIFAMSQDEPLESVYQAMAWVHQRGGGIVQVEPGSLRRGKRMAYLGCDERRGGQCFSDVSITVRP